MAKAKPVTEQPEASTEDKTEVRQDPRRPVLSPEVETKSKPKKVTTVGETKIEDY